MANMRIPDVFHDVYLRVTTLLTGGLFATIAALIYFSLGGADHLIVLYGIEGESPRFLGTVADVWGIVSVGGFIATVNLWIANGFYRRIKTFSYLIGYATLFFTVLLFIALAVIIATN